MQKIRDGYTQKLAKRAGVREKKIKNTRTRGEGQNEGGQPRNQTTMCKNARHGTSTCRKRKNKIDEST